VRHLAQISLHRHADSSLRYASTENTILIGSDAASKMGMSGAETLAVSLALPRFDGILEDDLENQ
jgi:hypothetical protein